MRRVIALALVATFLAASMAQAGASYRKWKHFDHFQLDAAGADAALFYFATAGSLTTSFAASQVMQKVTLVNVTAADKTVRLFTASGIDGTGTRDSQTFNYTEIEVPGTDVDGGQFFPVELEITSTLPVVNGRPEPEIVGVKLNGEESGGFIRSQVVNMIQPYLDQFAQTDLNLYVEKIVITDDEILITGRYQ